MLCVSYLSLKGVAMTDQTSRQTNLPVRLLAALPPALFGLVMSLCVVSAVPLRSVVWGAATPLRLPLSGQTLGVPAVMLGLLILLLVGGALAGLARRCAAWSHTWSTAAVVAVAMALSILADDVPYLISPLLDALMLVALVLILAAVAFVAARRGMSEAALVTMGFTSVSSLVASLSALGSPMLRMDIALAMAPAGLVFALLIVAFLRWQGRARWVALGLTAVLAGVLISVSGAAVASALSANMAWNLVRLFGAIAAAGFLSPLVLGWVLSLQRRPALQSA
jgi:hypothetical protein